MQHGLLFSPRNNRALRRIVSDTMRLNRRREYDVVLLPETEFPRKINKSKQII